MMIPDPTPCTGNTLNSWSCIILTLAMLTTLLLTFSTAFTIDSSDNGINLESHPDSKYRSYDIIFRHLPIYIYRITNT